MENESERNVGKQEQQMGYQDWVKSYCKEKGLDPNMEVCYSLSHSLTQSVTYSLSLAHSLPSLLHATSFITLFHYYY